MDEFKDPTPQAAFEEVNEAFRRKHNFPWDRVPVGKSFEVALNQIPNCQTLRTMASREGKKLGRRFRVIDHGDRFEVYYAGDRESGKVVVPEYKFVDPSNYAEPVLKAIDKRYVFKCYNCSMQNSGLGTSFKHFEENETQVRMSCANCLMWNVQDKQ